MIRIGTAGYSYKDWIGPFYPEGIKDSMMLDYYAQNFRFVELNSTFYHMPSQRLFQSLNKKTVHGFSFSVKLFGGFTHQRDCGQKEADDFRFALMPIVDNDKLICLLAQYPYSFHYHQENLDSVKRLRDWFPGMDVNVEFRNRGWIRSETSAALREQNLGFVCVDEPGLKGLVGNVAAATSKIGYLRMHGRNEAKWYAGEGSQRYDYLYDWNELNEWVPAIMELEKKTMQMVVSFNNHPIGKAIENARMIEKMIADLK